MPKAIARSKTRKAVAKRFKITAGGKVLRAHSSRRHLLSSKRAKRKRQLGKAALVHETDVARIKSNLPLRLERLCRLISIGPSRTGISEKPIPPLRWQVQRVLRNALVKKAPEAPNFCRHLHDVDVARLFLSVRGYGLRTYEPRQGRNAATVV